MYPLGHIDQFIRAIDDAQTVTSIAVALRKQIYRLGFEKFSYQLVRGTNGHPRPEVCITGYPQEWAKRYEEKNYISHDVVTAHAARTIRPFSWHDIGRFCDFTKEQKNILNEATEFKIKTGGTMPIHGPGLAKASFTVASSLPNLEFTKLFNAHRHEIHLLATYLHEKIITLESSEIRQPNIHLTFRETEVLTWTARGKTRAEISEILTIADSTVRAHLENICRKLMVTNKTHAAVAAVNYGLIVP